MKNKIIIIAILIVVLIMATSAGSFFVGMKYQQRKQPNFTRQFGSNNQQMAGRNRLGGRQVIGEIISQDSKTVTVKLTDGSSKIVLLSETTAINKAAEGTKDDLKTGEKVAVFGTDNADGSVTAQNIQINPVARNINPVNEK